MIEASDTRSIYDVQISSDNIKFWVCFDWYFHLMIEKSDSRVSDACSIQDDLSLTLGCLSANQTSHTLFCTCSAQLGGGPTVTNDLNLLKPHQPPHHLLPS